MRTALVITALGGALALPGSFVAFAQAPVSSPATWGVVALPPDPPIRPAVTWVPVKPRRKIE